MQNSKNFVFDLNLLNISEKSKMADDLEGWMQCYIRIEDFGSHYSGDRVFKSGLDWCFQDIEM